MTPKKSQVRFGSVCSGIEAASKAWEDLGWKAAWYSEIEAFPCAILKRHYPDVPNLGDMTKIHESEVFNGSAIDVLVGGTPCQSFSIAGLRKGMDDPRGNLALVFLALLDRKRPKWVVWENVPGVLSSWSDEAGSFEDEEGGRERGWQSNDFDTFTSGLAQLGYGVAWRVLDAQYFGVPQRRRRVFVVGYLGDWRRAATVLFESHSLSGHSALRRKAGRGIAGTISARTTGGGGLGTDFDLAGGLQIAHTLRGEGFDASEDGTGRGTPLVAGTLGANHGNIRAEDAWGGKLIAFGSKDSGGDEHPCVFTQNSRSEVREMGDRTGAVTSEPGAQCQNYFKAGMTVRRLTPVECSRLQGFPDDYLEINYADASQAHAVQILHELWKSASTIAREGWRPGIIASLLTPEILLAGVHVGWVSWEVAAKCSVASRTLSGAEPWPEGFVSVLRINAQRRPSPYRRESFEQCARQLGRPLSELPLERTQAETYLRNHELWEIAQKKWPLRYAFAKKKAGKNGLNPDGPRYKAIGNSMAVPVMSWIGERIQAVEDHMRVSK